MRLSALLLILLTSAARAEPPEYKEMERLARLRASDLSTEKSLRVLINQCLNSGEWKTAKPDREPDRIQGAEDLLNPAKIVTDVAQHEGGTTNAQANYGVRAYFKDAIESNDEFFLMAWRFYSELKLLDLTRKSKDFRESPIVVRAEQDLYSLAMKHGQQNPYIALKLLALYGHDNFNQTLGGCRGALLYDVLPVQNSQLYLNGAISGVEFSDQEIKAGQLLADHCKDPKKGDDHMLCNDGKKFYQADYYHVILSAFLGCRRMARQTLAQAGATSSTFLPKSWVRSFFRVTDSVADREYLDRVRRYKLDRFKEEAAGEHYGGKEAGSDNPVSPFFQSALSVAVQRIESGVSPALPSPNELKTLIQVDFTAQDYAAAQAISERYEFEVQFRVSQHQMGTQFGKHACENVAAALACFK